GFIIREICRNREVGFPKILDANSPILSPEMVVEMSVIEQAVPWQRISRKRTPFDKHTVNSIVDSDWIEILCERCSHCGTTGRSSQYIEFYACFAKCSVNPNMSRAVSTSAARNEA